jgi:hypothetical protein
MPPSRAYERARSTNAARAVKTAQLEQRVLELRAWGETFGDIGQRLNISPAAAEAAFSRALAKIPAGGAKEQRSLQLQRIGWLRKHLLTLFNRPAAKGEGKPAPGERCRTCGSSPGLSAVADKLIRLEEQEARLFGLDRPPKVDRHPGAPSWLAIDPKTRTEPDERLTIVEQRAFLFLVRKMRGEPQWPLPPFARPVNRKA